VLYPFLLDFGALKKPDEHSWGFAYVSGLISTLPPLIFSNRQALSALFRPGCRQFWQCEPTLHMAPLYFGNANSLHRFSTQQPLILATQCPLPMFRPPSNFPRQAPFTPGRRPFFANMSLLCPPRIQQTQAPSTLALIQPSLILATSPSCPCLAGCP